MRCEQVRGEQFLPFESVMGKNLVSSKHEHGPKLRRVDAGLADTGLNPLFLDLLLVI